MPARLEPNGLVGGDSMARPADVLIPPTNASTGCRQDGRALERSLDVVVTVELTFLLRVRTSFIRADIVGCAMLVYSG